MAKRVSTKTQVEDHAVIPLRDAVVFPHSVIPLLIGRKRSVASLDTAAESDKKIFLITQKEIETEEPEIKDLYNVGTLSAVHQVVQLPDGSVKILVEGLKRCRLEELYDDGRSLRGLLQSVKESVVSGTEVEALSRLVSSQFENYVKLNPRVPQEILIVAYNISTEPHKLSDVVASHLLIPVETKQQLLSTTSPVKRLRLLSEILAEEGGTLLGVITATEDAYLPVKRASGYLGTAAGPDDCYLALRGFRTLGVRLPRHQETALTLAHWLDGRAEVARVLHPALPGCPGHDIWARDFSGASGLFSIVLKGGAKGAVAAMLDTLELFGMGHSWGGYESLILPVHPENLRTATPWDGTGPVLRVHAGLEDPDDLIADLEKGLARFSAA